VEAYGKKHGFTAIKKRLMRHENGSIKHRSFGCEFGGRYKPQKLVDVSNHRDRKSKRQQCSWNANFNCPTNSQMITLTTLHDSHNHALFPADTEKYSLKYRCIPDDVLEEVQFFTEHGNLPIAVQRRLLKAKFPTLSILDRDLANAIQKYKVKSDVEHDASHLLKVLIQHKLNDPGWFVEFQLDQENRLTRLFWMSPTQIALWVEYHDVILNDNTAKTNRYNMPLSLFIAIDNNTRSRLVAQALVSDETTESYKWILECTKSATMSEPLVFVTDADPAADSAIGQAYEMTHPIHCIYHINENLPKNTKSKLSNQYENFVRDFYLCRNSLCEELFHERWSKLIEKYPSVKEYLMKTLYPSRQAWARVYTSKIFTAGVQTTSRVEGYNNIIKRELASNSTLCNLANVLDARLENEVKWNRFFEYHTLSTCMGIKSVSNDLFPKIDKLMSEYLSPHILSAERLEMAQCLYFIANKVESNITEVICPFLLFFVSMSLCFVLSFYIPFFVLSFYIPFFRSFVSISLSFVLSFLYPFLSLSIFVFEINNLCL